MPPTKNQNFQPNYPSANEPALRPGAGRRLFGFIVDSLAPLALTFIIAIALKLTHTLDDHSTLASSLYGGIYAFLFIFNRVYLDWKYGGSFGKKVIFSFVTSSTGGKLTLKQSILRNLWIVVLIIPKLSGGVITALVMLIIGISISRSPSNQSIMDKISSTQVLARQLN